jgi:hypothetical protein
MSLPSYQTKTSQARAKQGSVEGSENVASGDQDSQ